MLLTTTEECNLSVSSDNTYFPEKRELSPRGPNILFNVFRPESTRYHPRLLHREYAIRNLKLHKHEIILNFLKSNPYIPLVNFQKKFHFFSFHFRQNFEVRTFSRWLSIRGTKFFWRDIQNIFFQNVHLGPIRWVPKRFFKIWIPYSRNFYFNVGFLNNFSKIVACVCWAYAETILSHTEHTRKRFHRTLSIRRTNFSGWSASGKMLTVFTCTIYAEHTGKWFYRTLSKRGNDLNAGWAY